MLEAIRLVNARLPSKEAVSDATITAILFMAKAEVSFEFLSTAILSTDSMACSIFRETMVLGVFIWKVLGGSLS